MRNLILVVSRDPTTPAWPDGADVRDIAWAREFSKYAAIRQYNKEVLYDCWRLGESPLDGRFFFTWFLREAKDVRQAVYSWLHAADSVVVYSNTNQNPWYHITDAMKEVLGYAKEVDIPVVYRELPAVMVPPVCPKCGCFADFRYYEKFDGSAEDYLPEVPKTMLWECEYHVIQTAEDGTATYVRDLYNGTHDAA